MPTNQTKLGELLPLRTPNSKTWMNFDGSRTTEIHSRPIHFEDEHGNFHNINTDLCDEADFDTFDLPVNKHAVQNFQNAKVQAKQQKSLNVLNRDEFDFQGLQVPFEVKLPRNWKRGYTIGKGQDRLTFKPLKASPSKGYKNGKPNTVEYQDAWNDVDVKLELTDIGVKETLVLKTEQAPTSFQFEVDGELAEDFTSGELKLQPAWLIDANGTKRDVEQVIVQEDKTYLELNADVTGLAYPIEIDPTVTIRSDETSAVDTYVDRDSPSTNYGTSTFINVGGMPPSGSLNRALIKFDLSSIPNNAVILSDTFTRLTYYNYSSYAGADSDMHDYNVHRITANWDESTVTWNNQPSFDAEIYETLTKAINAGSDGLPWDFFIPTLVQEWIDGTYPNHGMLFKFLQESQNSGLTYFYSSSTQTTVYRPSLVVTYNIPPTTPTLTSPNGGETWNAQHTITWNASTDSDGDSILYDLQLSTDNGSTWSTIASGVSGTSYNYDFTNEPETSTALVRVRAYDGTSYSAWDESDGVFTIQHNQAPTQPTNLSPNGEPRDRTQVIRFSWEHNDDVGDPQSKFDLEWREQGTTTWNVVTRTTPQEYYDMNGGTFVNAQIEWRVRTYDQEGLSSPYSNIAVFTAGDPSNAPTITSSGTVNVANPTVTWSSADQVTFDLTVKQSGNTVYTHSGGTNKAHTIQYDLQNQTDYTLELTITNSDGLISDPAIQTLSVSYTPPSQPSVTTSDVEGGIQLNIENPAPQEQSEPRPIYNNIFRRDGEDWKRIAIERAIEKVTEPVSYNVNGLDTLTSAYKGEVVKVDFQGKTVVNHVPLFDSGLWNFHANVTVDSPTKITHNNTSGSAEFSPINFNAKESTAYFISGLFTNGSYGYVRMLDSSGTELSTAYDNNSFTTPAGTKEIQIRLYTPAQTGTFTFENIMLNEGSTAQEFVANVKPIKNPVLFSYGKNLIPNNWTVGELSGGALITGSNYVSDYVKIIPTETYTYSGNIEPSDKEHAYYDKNKNYISRAFTNDMTNIPSNAEYVRFEIPPDLPIEDVKMQLELGTTATEFTEYNPSYQVLKSTFYQGDQLNYDENGNPIKLAKWHEEYPTVSNGQSTLSKNTTGNMDIVGDNGEIILDYTVSGNTITWGATVPTNPRVVYELTTVEEIPIETEGKALLIEGQQQVEVQYDVAEPYLSARTDLTITEILTHYESTYTDYTVASGKTYEYYVRAWGDNDTYSDSAVVSDSVAFEETYLSAMNDPSNMVKLDKVMSVRQPTQVNRTLMQFAGRKQPVAYFDESESWNVELQCLVYDIDLLRELAKSRDMLLYRDERGRRRFVTLDGMVENDLLSEGLYEVTLNPIETAYEEEV